MTFQPFSTDLSDAEWQILGPLLQPASRRGRPRKHARRTMLDAVLYGLRGGVPWRLLPHAFPPWRSVYDQFRRWRQSGVWRRINDVLRGPTRQLAGRTATRMQRSSTARRRAPARRAASGATTGASASPDASAIWWSTCKG